MPHAGAPAGGSAVLDTAVVGDSDSGAGVAPVGLSGNGTGTPNSPAGPGTWSPQWGWYVNMTPPQVSGCVIIIVFYSVMREMVLFVSSAVMVLHQPS